MPGDGVRSGLPELPAASGLFYFWPRGCGTPDRRCEHPLFRAPATREPPDSGKMGLKRQTNDANAPGCFGAPKPDIVVEIVGLVVVADGAGHVVWLIVPRAPAQHAR